jgi:chemotaxis protein methyltransferase CheR
MLARFGHGLVTIRNGDGRMERTLRELQQVMAAHRQVLAEVRALATNGAAGSEVAEPLPPHADERQRLIDRLAADVERVSGIAMTRLIEAKLGRVLASVELGELAAWTGRLHLLPASDPEWLSLIESLTVHETFFHRDRVQLDLLSRILRGIIARAAQRHRYRLRLWSAACATGEEAYTLAILALLALRDAGVADETDDGGIVCRPPWRLDVLGTDISRLVLVQAKAAVYSSEGLGAFRGLPAELLRFFPRLPGCGAGIEIERRGVHADIRRHVRFEQSNLMAHQPPDTGFDIVLCRNVLIYLTPPARSQAQSLCRQALRCGGYLLLGPTDALAEPAAFEPCWGTGAVAYALKSPR